MKVACNQNSNNLVNSKIGETNLNVYGSRMTIINYINNKNITVLFDNGFKSNTRYDHFIEGSVKHPYDRTICNIGFLGEGDYKVKIKGKHTKAYSIWNNIIQRCYNPLSQIKNITYKDCLVCDDWHNFQNFAKWYYENYYEVQNQNMCLDKDILIKGNKIYSPKTCVFVPNDINVLFTKRQNDRGDYPIGVTYVERDKKYLVQCSSKNNKSRFVKYCDSAEEAFYIYKEYKENIIKLIAEKYKPQIPELLYLALINYKVEIND